MGAQALIDDWSHDWSEEVDDAGLGSAIALLSSQINAANHRLLALIARFDRSGGWREQGAMRSCAHWLAARCGISLGAAREKVRVARQLEVLPELREAFAGGDLSYSKVRAVTRVATPENEGFMLGLAQENSAGHLERLVSRYQPVAAPGLDGLLEADDARASHEAGTVDESGDAGNVAALEEEVSRELARGLVWFQDDEGMWVLNARLPPEQGQLVIKALQAVARPLEEARHEAWKAKQKARMQAVARRLLERQKAGSSTDQTADVTSPTADLPEAVIYARAEEKISAETFSQHMDQIRADALIAMVEHFLASEPDSGCLQGVKGSDRSQVVLHVDINTLREQKSGVCCVHGRAHFESRPWLAPSTARRLSCDASLVSVLEDEVGRVLNVGRRSRIVPEHIRRALRERDGVCRYPGCQEAEYVEAHHIRHWADGGETRLDNLVTLCRFHHRQLHRGCFDIRLDGSSAEILVAGDKPT
jgi:hypothetical protein